MPEFEWDERKSTNNREKHGIDFSAARELWNDPDMLVIPAGTADEPRSLVIGRIGDRHWSAVTTQRETRVRIISVRRSRIEEVTLYESKEV